MKNIYVTLILILCSIQVFADEGMWLPSLISNRVGDMQEKGFKLTAEDVYSINQASLKDGIVHFGRGCTGGLISAQGLLITNHHCGYRQIQSHSSVEHDYLTDGFWAMTREQELPNNSLTVRFLVKMEDVTTKVLRGYKKSMTEEQRIKLVSKNSKAIIKIAVKGGLGYQAKVEGLYYGNQYFLFVYQEFSDIRLVGAPPSSIGKFGGDTDNWMWPRHTGDFALFRIYANKDNNPATYSEDNIPYVPKKFFNISLNGVKEGDFTMVYGFPGRTQEYILSDAVEYIVERSNPHKIRLRTLILDIQNAEMDKSTEVRIKYSSKNAGVANAWKKWQGETKGIIKMNTVDNKKAYEQAFIEWSKDMPEYANLITTMKDIYKVLYDYNFVNDYQKEAIRAIEAVSFSDKYIKAIDKKKELIDLRESFFKDYYEPIDKDVFIALLTEYSKNIDPKFQSEYFKQMMQKYSNSIEKWAENIYSKSIMVDEAKLAVATKEDILNDPFVVFYKEFDSFFKKNISPIIEKNNKELALLYRIYMRGQIAFDKAINSGRAFYPDANSTLRVSYGEVKGYKPADAVYFTPSSSLEGIMQKDNPNIYDYNIPQVLRDIYVSKDYGRWEVDGSIPVCFIATNHTSGGNSGSPVLDANGNFIGINFDRVWEGTMSDIVFDPEICRNIALDIRYALFIIDKVAGASHLVDEMVLIED